MKLDTIIPMTGRAILRPSYIGIVGFESKAVYGWTDGCVLA